MLMNQILLYNKLVNIHYIIQKTFWNKMNKPLQFVAQGTQSTVFLGQYQGQDAAFIVQQDGEDIQNRIKIHQLLNKVDGVMKMKGYFPITDDIIKFFPLQQIQEGQQVLICDYIDGFPFDHNLYDFNLVHKFSTFLKLCLIVQKMHNHGVFHFDIKPDNILVTKEGNPFVIDLGSARNNLTRNTQKIDILEDNQYIVDVTQHTPMFAPQKYHLYNHYIADKFDVYSLGCIMHLLITEKYIQKPIKRNSQTAKVLIKQHGVIAADFLCGALDPDDLIRYSIQQLISHPLLTKTQPSILDLLLFHIDYESQIRSSCVKQCKSVDRDTIRSHSINHSILNKKQKHDSSAQDDIYIRQNKCNKFLYNDIQQILQYQSNYYEQPNQQQIDFKTNFFNIYQSANKRLFQSFNIHYYFCKQSLLTQTLSQPLFLKISQNSLTSLFQSSSHSHEESEVYYDDVLKNDQFHRSKLIQVKKRNIGLCKASRPIMQQLQCQKSNGFQLFTDEFQHQLISSQAEISLSFSIPEQPDNLENCKLELDDYVNQHIVYSLKKSNNQSISNPEPSSDDSQLSMLDSFTMLNYNEE